jgi:actin-like ATPase involved in cell morphogenesis
MTSVAGVFYVCGVDGGPEGQGIGVTSMYVIGVDLGTTFTAAATWRERHAEIVSLGGRTAAIPSVLLLREDGTYLAGDAGARRAVLEPQRVAREFKRRLGDTVPVMLGGTPVNAETLMARLLQTVVDEVTTREGGAPSKICLCHPANWGPFKIDLLTKAIRSSGLTVPVTFTTEPEAAAAFYARQQRIEPGSVVAVYDLGGGTFDAAVLRKTAAGFEILGRPEGIERLGGIDFDAAVFNHVAKALGPKLTELDEDDPAVTAAVARLRAECVDAKEVLSVDTDASIAVVLPTVTTEVRITRAELEAMVRPALQDTVGALKRALTSAGVSDDLRAVLLVGGSSRMPIVSQLVASELGYPVAVDAHPKHAVALGAAWIASGAAADPPAPAKVEGRVAPGAAEPTAVVPTPTSAPTAAPTPAPTPSPLGKAPTAPPVSASPYLPGKASVPSAPRAAESGATTIIGSAAPAGVARVGAPAWSTAPSYDRVDHGRSGRWRTVVIYVAAAALVAALAAGSIALLGGRDSGNNTAGPDSTAPATTDGVAPTTSPAAPVTTSAAPPPVTYPQTANAYALAAVQAWRQGNQGRVDQLVAAGNGIFDILNAGDYNKQFAVYKCTSGGGYSQCALYNKVGDVLELKISDDLLGEAHAIADGVFAPITFPLDLREYGQLTLDDWKRENKAAVALLTTEPQDSAFNTVPDERRNDTWTYDRQDAAAGKIYHIWRNAAGDEIALGFNNPDIVPPPANRHNLVVSVTYQPAT